MFANQSKRKMLLKVFCVFATRIRVFVIPVLLAQTTIALVLSGEMTSQNILLDSVAATILCHLDDIYRHFFIPPPVGRGTEDVYADEYASLVHDATKSIEFKRGLTAEIKAAGLPARDFGRILSERGRTMEFRHSPLLSRLAPTPEVRAWTFTRVWIFLIGVGIFIQILGMETWMRRFGGENAGGTRAACSDIASIGRFVSMWSLYISMSVFEVYRLIENCLRGKHTKRQLCARFFVGILMDALACFFVDTGYNCVKRLHSRSIVHGF
jgi:hypothetical protein